MPRTGIFTARQTARMSRAPRILTAAAPCWAATVAIAATKLERSRAEPGRGWQEIINPFLSLESVNFFLKAPLSIFQMLRPVELNRRASRVQARHQELI